MPADVNVCIYALVPLFLNLWVSVRSICMPREEKPAAVFHGFQQDLEVARCFFFFFPQLITESQHVVQAELETDDYAPNPYLAIYQSIYHTEDQL